MNAMKPRPLQLYCDSDDCTWSLSLDGRVFRLALGPRQAAIGEKTVAEIREPRQVDAVISRIGDASITPQQVAAELMDLLLTLATRRPDEESISFLVWRLREWVAESRRTRNGGHAA